MFRNSEGGFGKFIVPQKVKGIPMNFSNTLFFFFIGYWKERLFVVYTYQHVHIPINTQANTHIQTHMGVVPKVM